MPADEAALAPKPTLVRFGIGDRLDRISGHGAIPINSRSGLSCVDRWKKLRDDVDSREPVRRSSCQAE